MTESAEPREADLTRDWVREQQDIMAISGRYEGLKELSDGYAFRYAPGWEARVRVVADYLQQHYTYFQTTLVVDGPRAPVWLHIRGPAGTKQWLEQGFAYASGRLTPDGTRFLGRFEKLVKVGFRIATSPLRVLPDFLIIGAAKCGTTSLYSYLLAHPQIAPAFRKEVYYFDMSWGRNPLRYRAHFPTALSRRLGALAGRPPVTGEATPCYLFDPRVPRRVQSLVPNAKLIVLLGNPTDRAYSFYCMMVRRGLETLPFRDALEREEERLAGELDRMLADERYFSLRRHHHSYLARGRYAEQLEGWLQVFSRPQLLIVSQDDLRRQRERTLLRIVDFLGLPKARMPDTGERNSVPHERMSDADRRWLVDYFRPHNARLQELVGLGDGWNR